MDSVKLLPLGTKAKFAGTERVGEIAGYATVHLSAKQTTAMYVLNLGDDNGFYSPGRDTFVTLLLVSANNIEEVKP